MRSRCRRASVLIVALWCLFFLSGLAVAIYVRIAPQVRLVGHLRDKVKGYYAAKAGVRQAMFMMNADVTQDYDALNDIWVDNEETLKDIEISKEASVSVKYEWTDEQGVLQTRYGLIDEESKININTASLDTFEHLLESIGQATSSQVTDIANAILDWVDEDSDLRPNSAEEGYYAGLSPSYPCANAKFAVPEELLLVKGMTLEIFNKIRPFITVYGSGRVNINTAGEHVLEAIGLERALIDKVFRFRRGNDGQEGTADDNVFQAMTSVIASLNSAVGLSEPETQQLNLLIAAEVLSVGSNYFYGESWVQLLSSAGDSHMPLKVVFIFDRGKNIRFWREG